MALTYLTLPASWAQGCPFLIQLWLHYVPTAGLLPPSWGSKGSFPLLQDLELSFTNLFGPLPAEWGSPTGFRKLQNLVIYSCDINGNFSSCSWSLCSSFGDVQIVVMRLWHLSTVS